MQLGDTIGPYKLVEVLGEGGMGTVFLAEQREPVRRRVALKLIKPGMDSRQVLARFAQERQALALMDHPHIAKVFDAGTTATGQPYFVMELVRGVSITDYCDRERLAPAARLDLFLPVCHAVQHAHQKGVLHRDLKPGNVLIALVDGQPVAKVIDFGVAKALHTRLTEETVFTELGVMVGTIEYMAPEQADPNNLDVDTRADIYSLGVLLYELLTGGPPFSSRDLRSAPLIEMLRILREVEPLKPSTRVSTAADVERIAAQRSLAPDRLARRLHGDLDWIVLKCLAKERHRRYDSAAAVAHDIERHLSHEPVLARPPSAGYRLRKLVERNKLAFSAAAAIAVMLVAATATSLVFATRAGDAEKRARLEAAITSEVNRFLREDLIVQASPWGQTIRDPDLKVRTLLDRASERVAARFENAPLVESSVRETIANAYWSLGLFEPARPHFERAVELRTAAGAADAAETWTTQSQLGYALAKLGESERGEKLMRAALEQQSRVLGGGAAETIRTVLRLADAYKDTARYEESEALLSETIAGLRERGEGDSEDALKARAVLATLLTTRGRFEEAQELYAEAIPASVRVRGADHPGTLGLRSHKASALLSQDLVVDGERELRALLAEVRRSLGPDAHLVFEIGLNLALACLRQGKLAEAETFAKDALDGYRRIGGPESTMSLKSEQVLAEVYIAQDRIAEALPLLDGVVAAFRKRFGDEHPQTTDVLARLGVLYMQRGDFDAAEPLYTRLLEIYRVRVGPKHNASLTLLQNVAIALDGQGKLAAAEERWLEVLALCPAGAEAVRTVREGALSSLGRNRLNQEKYAEAEPLLRECLSLREQHDPDNWRRFNVMSLLGGSLLGQERYAESEPLLLAGYQGMKEREATIDPLWKKLLPDAAARLVELYEALGRPEEAARWRDV